ncbi:hypothetical protein JYU34_004971 [Plutella xylostella]|uniref:Uncharacterized protein n=1 Tax=Plutella xylostella TaxID=51655 RepID=A0ABQ7QVK5_PLUXY|nr:hypothetical protein JYU34_004971 [Plutella xylostella]
MSDKIMELSPNLRKCRIYSEEPLEWFPAGGKLLCTLECEMRFTARQCGCLRPNHPLPPGLRACRAYKLACARHAGVSSTEFCDCPSTCQADRAIIRKQSFPLALNNATLDPI